MFVNLATCRIMFEATHDRAMDPNMTFLAAGEAAQKQLGVKRFERLATVAQRLNAEGVEKEEIVQRIQALMGRH